MLKIFSRNKNTIEIDQKEIDNFLYNKKQKLLNMFSEIGTKQSVGFVLEETGIKNQQTLKSMLCRLRKDGLNIKMKWGYLTRVE